MLREGRELSGVVQRSVADRLEICLPRCVKIQEEGVSIPGQAEKIGRKLKATMGRVRAEGGLSPKALGSSPGAQCPLDVSMKPVALVLSHSVSSV